MLLDVERGSLSIYICVGGSPLFCMSVCVCVRVCNGGGSIPVFLGVFFLGGGGGLADQRKGWGFQVNLAIWRVLNYETMLTGGGGLAL